MEPNRRPGRRSDVSPRTLVALVGACIALVACSGKTTEGPAAPTTPGPDAAVSSTPDNSRSTQNGALRVTSRINLEDPRPVAWDRYEPLRGGTALDLYYWSGVEECYGFDHPEVIYQPRRIIVTLYEGRVPGVETCIELAVRKVVEVALGEPVGGRKVVDGAKD